MRTLPQRFLESFHQFGDRCADQTMNPIECCGSPATAATESSSTNSLVLVGPPEDMFATSIAQLGKQLDAFLTPVPDVSVQEYDTTEFEARDEEPIVMPTNHVASADMFPPDERQLDQPPPLLEVVSMESSADNADAVSLLCDNIDGAESMESSSVSSSSCEDEDDEESEMMELTRDQLEPTKYGELHDINLLDCPEDEKHVLGEAETDAKDIEQKSAPQLPTEAVVNIPEQYNFEPVPEQSKIEPVQREVEAEGTKPVVQAEEPTNKYCLVSLKRHKILGEGQFGQVWLVSPAKEVQPKAYALKVLSKLTLITEDLVDAIIRERDIMLRLKGHPFIAELHSSFQDSRFVFLLEEFCQGGELFSVMHDKGKLPIDQAKFYSICIADALVFLHNQDIIFRDLKPENVMIDQAGYPKMIDFGYAKEVRAGEKTYSFCGTPRYLSPEMIGGVGHGPGVDHWALGILIFEQVTAENPFCYEGIDEPSLFESIQQDEIDYSKLVDKHDEDALDIVQRLLVKDYRKRLGVEGSFQVLEHSWFAGMDLAKLRAKQIAAPWLPKIKNVFDCCCFDDWEGLVEDKLDVDYPDLSASEERKFRDF